MMDMEMNAELERDGGSETGEASTEGSSAASVYCTLEQDFAKITSEMKSNEALAAYEAEYTRLFESLYKAQRLEEELTGKCRSLEQEVAEGSSKMLALEQRIEAEASSVEQLRHEILQSKRLADSAHTREQRAQEVIESLRVSVGKLSEEIAQKNRQLASEERAPSKQQQKDGSKERERLLNEMDTLKQRLKKLGQTSAELQAKLTEAEGRASELQESGERLANDLAAERRHKDKCEAELQATHLQLELRSAELQAAEDKLKESSSKAAALEAQLREQAQEGERAQKEIQRLMLKQMSLKLEAERLLARSEQARKESSELALAIKDMSREIERRKDELGKARADKDNALKKLTKERALAERAEEGARRAAASLRSAELEVAALKRQAQAEQKAAAQLGREREAALKSAAGLEEANRRLGLETRVLEQANRKMGLSLDDMSEAAAELRRQVGALEKERERCAADAQELARKLDDYADQLKLQRLEAADWQRRLADAEAKLRQQQALFEEVRGERNAFKKSLGLAQQDLAQLGAKLKALGEQLEQAREQLAQREAALLKHEFLLGKADKEKEALRAELASGRAVAARLHAQAHEQRQEERRLRQSLAEADASVGRQAKEIEAVMGERDIVGGQLVRRNDELALQRNQLQLLQASLGRGERDYAQRLADLRMLQLELKKLRLDNEALRRNAAGLSDLRAELFHLERDLTKERLKVTALEDDLQNPLNLHRWRSLEATDPDSFELLQKIQILQKRVLKLSSQVIDKDKKIADTEKLYVNLREVIAKQPGPEVLVCLNKTRRALRDRSKRMKCLVAELNMTLQGEHKFEISKIRRELNSMKAKYMAQKRKQLRGKSSPSKDNRPAAAGSKFYGGGFNVSVPIATSCTTAIVPIDK